MKNYSRTVKTSGLGWTLALAATFTPVAMTHSAQAEDRQVEHRVAPTYPELAKRMRVSGKVLVSAVVSADGSVSSVKAESGNRMLAPAAEDAVRHWKFASGPAQSTVVVEVAFQLTD